MSAGPAFSLRGLVFLESCWSASSATTTAFGGSRAVDMLGGDPLPRSC
jgi:hypothetical protein